MSEDAEDMQFAGEGGQERADCINPSFLEI